MSTEWAAETQLLTLTILCLEQKLLGFQHFCILSVEGSGEGDFHKGFVNTSSCCYLNSSGVCRGALCLSESSPLGRGGVCLHALQGM